MQKALSVFLCGTFGQMLIVCAAVCILRKVGVSVNDTTAIGMGAIVLAGISSALWGIIVSSKYKGVAVSEVFFDFLNVKVSYRYYLAVLLFLALDFAYVFIGGQIKISHWYLPVVLFLKAILFGGIEEIGWRYTFQPIVEEKAGFIVATLVTFILWGTWHFLYFYVEGTIQQIQVFPFLAGLLTNCFILASLYKYSGSLWICVMTHALINMMAQISSGGNGYVSSICKIVIIVAACILVKLHR